MPPPKKKKKKKSTFYGETLSVYIMTKISANLFPESLGSERILTHLRPFFHLENKRKTSSSLRFDIN